MGLLRRRPVAVAYWLLALVLSVFAGIGAANLAVGTSPEPATDAPDGEVATNGAQLVYGVVGFIVGLLGVIALFAGLWLLLWARERRAQSPEEFTGDDDGDFQDLLDDADER